MYVCVFFSVDSKKRIPILTEIHKYLKTIDIELLKPGLYVFIIGHDHVSMLLLILSSIHSLCIPPLMFTLIISPCSLLT